MGARTIDLQQEHEELSDILVDAESAGPSERVVQRLRDWVPGHFVREEQGPFAWARARAPELSARLDALIEDHRALEAAVHELDGSRGNEARLRAVLAELRLHERREAELLAEIAYQEPGAGD